MGNQILVVVCVGLMSMLGGAAPARAQAVGEPQVVNVYHPLMTTESYDAAVNAQNEAFMARIRESRESRTVCQHEVCVKSVPNPYSPAGTTVDYSSELAFLAYVQASIEIDQCPDKSCAEAAVQRIPGVVRDLEAVSDTPSP